MRSIYTLVSHAISDLPYLKPAVALVLGFVGGKMFAEFFHYEISVGLSLAVVSGPFPCTLVCTALPLQFTRNVLACDSEDGKRNVRAERYLKTLPI